MTRKRVLLTLEEKLWIIKCRADNENIKQTKIAVDFKAKFNRPVTRQCVSQVLKNKSKILRMAGKRNAKKVELVKIVLRSCNYLR